MSISELSKDCLYHLMSYLPCPMDKRNVVLAIRTGAAQSAFEEPSLWRRWQNLNVTDSLFLVHPKMITIVLDNVAKIDKISLSLITDEKLSSVDKIIDGIEQSKKEVWDAKQLEINVRDSHGRESEALVHLLGVILKRLGKSVVTLKCHDNERPTFAPTIIETLFECIMESDKFQSTTQLDLNVPGSNVGLWLKEVLQRLPLKRLKLQNMHCFTMNSLDGTLENLEELTVVDSIAFSPEMVFSIYDANSFPLMKKVAFTCDTLHEGVRWNSVCGQCFSHCSSHVVVTRPVRAIENDDLHWDENLQSMLELLRSFIETQIVQELSEEVRHDLTLGQNCDVTGIYCFQISMLKRWMDQYGFQEERTENSMKYKVKESSHIIFLCNNMTD